MDEPPEHPLDAAARQLREVCGPGDEETLREVLRAQTAAFQEATEATLTRLAVNEAMGYVPEKAPPAEGEAAPGTLRAHLDGQVAASHGAGEAGAAAGDPDKVVEARLAEAAAERRRRAVLARRRSS